MTGAGEPAIIVEPYDFDDALIAATRADGHARLAVYPGKFVAAVLGRGSKPEVELNLAAIRADGIPAFKRPGGGCAVLLDPGNVIVSVVLPLPGLGGLRAAFDAISDWIIAGLARTGISGIEKRGISDLTLGDRKVGGACLYRARDLLYYSTTLLVSPDLELVERYLAHPPREPEYRRGRRHADFMGILAETRPGLSAAGLVEALARILDPALISLEGIEQQI